MSENTPGIESFEGRESVDPLTPITRGSEFVEDHHRFWLVGGNEPGTPSPEAVAALRGLAAHPYPPMRSEVYPIGLGEVVEYVAQHVSQPDKS